MSSGVQRRRNGAVVGTGNLLEVRTVGFRPSKVSLTNLDGLAKGDWNETLPDDSVVKQVTAGTISNPTSNGIIPLSDGFSLGTDADLNVSGETVHWEAWE